MEKDVRVLIETAKSPAAGGAFILSGIKPVPRFYLPPFGGICGRYCPPPSGGCIIILCKIGIGIAIGPLQLLNLFRRLHFGIKVDLKHIRCGKGLQENPENGDNQRIKQQRRRQCRNLHT